MNSTVHAVGVVDAGQRHDEVGVRRSLERGELADGLPGFGEWIGQHAGYVNALVSHGLRRDVDQANMLGAGHLVDGAGAGDGEDAGAVIALPVVLHQVAHIFEVRLASRCYRRGKARRGLRLRLPVRPAAGWSESWTCVAIVIGAPPGTADEMPAPLLKVGYLGLYEGCMLGCACAAP